MNPARFNTIAKTLAAALPRRPAVRLLAASALGATLGRSAPEEADAGPGGCRNWKKRCRRDDQCCSGVCAGKNGKKKCRAHDQLDCTVDNGFCRSGGSAPSRCGPTGSCVCNVTTGKAPHCGGAAFCPPVPCQQDADCGVPGAACIAVALCQGCGMPATE
ncbi:MAG TPA: hypothetical protein VFU81_16140, partial [Thermomicrobiales bacterium]|nr:hypothetical protein [Thermomicrobiales bacterium]